MKLNRFLVFILVIIVLGFLAYYYPKLTGESISNTEYQKEAIFVSRVIDGDTIEDENGQSYRLLGINTKSIQSS